MTFKFQNRILIHIFISFLTNYHCFRNIYLIGSNRGLLEPWIYHNFYSLTWKFWFMLLGGKTVTSDINCTKYDFQKPVSQHHIKLILMGPCAKIREASWKQSSFIRHESTISARQRVCPSTRSYWALMDSAPGHREYPVDSKSRK